MWLKSRKEEKKWTRKISEEAKSAKKKENLICKEALRVIDEKSVEANQGSYWKVNLTQVSRVSTAGKEKEFYSSSFPLSSLPGFLSLRFNLIIDAACGWFDFCRK